MATLEENLEEHLKCAVCLGRFEGVRVLTCQHLHCKKCLERLVQRVDRRTYHYYEITCPECREKTEVPNGDVSALPSNYVINRLLLECSDSKPSCQKHEGEILKLFCQNCDQLICRDCIVIDHRDHKYNFIKDVFPAEKENILMFVNLSKVRFRYVEVCIEKLKGQEQSLNTNFLEVNQNIDSLIDKQIELLQQKRQSLKEQLQKSVFKEKHKIQTRLESYVSSLACDKNNVEIIEQTLSEGSEIDVLSAKHQMIHQLTDICFHSATNILNPSDKVLYALDKAHPPLDEQTVDEMVNIKEIHGQFPQFLKKFFFTFIRTANLSRSGDQAQASGLR